MTAAGFAALLARLGPDAERAGSAYEHLRRALVSFFAWRGAATPEECAEETLDRLARRLGEGVAVEDVARFARGIARLVLLEHWRHPEPRSIPLDDAGHGAPALEAPDEAPSECLSRCLGELEPEGRDVILEYYGGDGRSRIDGRKRMARALGVSENALRSRAQRLRDRLTRCITHCLSARRAGGASGSDTKSRE
jgi:DNA-directed RNA polymerase specialized sigma24 family protein